jgi:hypothetical protein
VVQAAQASAHPRPAPTGRALQHEHALNPNDAAVLIFNDTQHEVIYRRELRPVFDDWG